MYVVNRTISCVSWSTAFSLRQCVFRIFLIISKWQNDKCKIHYFKIIITDGHKRSIKKSSWIYHSYPPAINALLFCVSTDNNYVILINFIVWVIPFSIKPRSIKIRLNLKFVYSPFRFILLRIVCNCAE